MSASSPTRAPVPKVAAAGIAGALGAIVVWALGLGGVEVPPEIAAALVALLTFATGYLKAPAGALDDDADAARHNEVGGVDVLYLLLVVFVVLAILALLGVI